MTESNWKKRAVEAETRLQDEIYGDSGLLKQSNNLRVKSELMQKMIEESLRALSLAKQALAWSRPFSGQSCDGKVTLLMASMWKEQAEEAVDAALALMTEKDKDESTIIPGGNS